MAEFLCTADPKLSENCCHFVGSPEYLGNVNFGSFACILGKAFSIFEGLALLFTFSDGNEKFTVVIVAPQLVISKFYL